MKGTIRVDAIERRRPNLLEVQIRQIISHPSVFLSNFIQIVVFELWRFDKWQRRYSCEDRSLKGRENGERKIDTSLRNLHCDLELAGECRLL